MAAALSPWIPPPALHPSSARLCVHVGPQQCKPCPQPCNSGHDDLNLLLRGEEGDEARKEESKRAGGRGGEEEGTRTVRV